MRNGVTHYCNNRYSFCHETRKTLLVNEFLLISFIKNVAVKNAKGLLSEAEAEFLLIISF